MWWDDFPELELKSIVVAATHALETINILSKQRCVGGLVEHNYAIRSLETIELGHRSHLRLHEGGRFLNGRLRRACIDPDHVFCLSWSLVTQDNQGDVYYLTGDGLEGAGSQLDNKIPLLFSQER